MAKRNKKALLGFLSGAMLFISLLTIQNAIAQKKSTSFENRPICEENNGVWREFGDGCANNCEAKFQKYQACTRELIYNCDCGQGKCWLDNKCVTISSYKRKFDKEEDERQKELDARRKEREEKMRTDPNLAYYMHNLYKKDQAAAANTQMQNSSSTASAQTTQNKDQNNINNQATSPQNATVVQPQRTMQAVIPPAFIEEQKKRNETINSDGKTQDLVFPIVPLPQ